MGTLRCAAAILAASIWFQACDRPATAPHSPTDDALAAAAGMPPAGGTTLCSLVGFDELQTNGAPFTTLSRCGLTITATAASWTASTTYGKPAPFIQFVAAAGATAIGEVQIAGSGTRFSFRSVDLYSSTTPIPYAITGVANGATALTVAGTHGNTFGNFATIVNPQPGAMLDSLVISLTNPSAPCCSNPMGLDNIVIGL